MMSYETARKAAMLCSNSSLTCSTVCVSALPLVPPISILGSLLNWTIVWKRSRLSWQRSRNSSMRRKMAVFWTRHGLVGHSALAVAL